jgi:hypothetical protein
MRAVTTFVLALGMAAPVVLPVPGDSIEPAADESSGKRGCCSHHHGVCGCKDGRVVCCDKTLSPSCTC